MSSFWIEQQARQRIEEFASDARGDQLVGTAAPITRRGGVLGRRPSLRPRAWIDSVVTWSRHSVARAR